jgi:hypothetical protein
MIDFNHYPLPDKAPKLMPFQDEPFNGDTFAMEKVVELQKEFNLTNAVETGTCFGSTTQFFAQAFDRVLTIEYNRTYHSIARDRLLKLRNIEFERGDSAQVLQKKIEGMGNDTLFFLDAHWEKSCPLIDELIQIGNSRLKPVIMIHDFKVPDYPELGFDSYNGIPFTFAYVKKQLDRIYGFDGYNHEYNSQAKGAKRGIIYITPKTAL